MIEGNGMFAAVSTALRSLDAAAGVRVPLFRSRAAIETIHGHLDVARGAFEEAAVLARTEAGRAVRDLVDAAELTEQARGALQARSGVDELHRSIDHIRSSAVRAVVAASQDHVGAVDPAFVHGHLAELGPTALVDLRDAVGEGLAAHLAGPVDRIDWARIARVAELPEGARPDMFGAPAWGTLSSGSRPGADWDGWRTVNRLRAVERFPSPEAARARLNEIAALDDASLRPSDLHDLDGLLQIVTPGLAGSTVEDAAAHAVRLADGVPVPSNWPGLALLDDVHEARGWADRDSATRAMRAILGRSAEDIGSDDLRALARLAKLPEDLRPVGLETNIPKTTTHDTLVQVARLLHQGAKVNEKWGGWRMLNRLRAEAQHTTRESATRRLLEIAATPRNDLTRGQLHELDGLRQLGDDLRPVGLDPDLKAFVVAEQRGKGVDIDRSWAGWSTLEQLHASNRWMNRASATTAMRRAIGASADDVGAAELRQLALIAALPDGVRPTGLETSIPKWTTSDTFHQVADLLDAGSNVNANWGGWKTLNHLRAEATYTTRSSVEDRVLELVTKPRADLTRAELHELDGLRQLPPELRPPGMDPDFKFHDAAELVGSGKGIPENWAGWEALDALEASMRWPTRDAATATARELVRSSPDDVTPEDLRQLAKLASLPDELRPEGLVVSILKWTTSGTLRQVAGLIEDGKVVNERWGGWPMLNRVRAEATFTSRAEATARLHEIVTTPRDALSRRDLHDLDGLRQLPDDLRPVGLGREVSTYMAAEQVGRGIAVKSDWAGWELMDGLEAAVRWPTRDAATAAARELVGGSIEDITPERLRELAKVASLAEDLRPVGLHTDIPKWTTAGTLRQVADIIDRGDKVNTKWGGWPMLNRVRAEGAYASRAEASARLRELVAKPSSELTRADLHELDGMRQLGDELRPLELATDVPTYSAAELRGRGEEIPADWEGWELIEGIDAAATWATRDAATAAAHDVLRGSIDDVTAADLRVLARIATLAPELRPEGLETAITNWTTAGTFRQVAGLMDDGSTINAKWAGWPAINRLRGAATYPTREGAASRMREIAAMPRDELTRADLHDFDALRQLSDDLRPAGLDPELGAFHAAELRGAGKDINPNWRGWRAIEGIALEQELPVDVSARDDLLRELLAERIRSGATPELLDRVLRLRLDVVPADRQDLARIMLANDLLKQVPSSRIQWSGAPQQALVAAKAALADVHPTDPRLAKLADDTRTLVDRNLARIAGVKGPVAGYSNFTDLAEVGRVGSNVEFLERTWNAASTAPTNPSATAAATVDEAAEAGAAETLTW